MIEIPQMLLIGSTSRNSGKTTLAAGFIRKWKGHLPIVGLKITSVREDHRCPHGERGCGACSEFSGSCELLEEAGEQSGKDTSILLDAGCEKVYWLKTLRQQMSGAIRQFLALAPAGALIVCESNSLRNVAVPGVFVMIDNARSGGAKESALNVLDKADIVATGDMEKHLDTILADIEIDRRGDGLRVKKRVLS